MALKRRHVAEQTGLTPAELADAECVSVRTVRYWTRLGCPHTFARAARGARLGFDLAAVRVWRRRTGKQGVGSGPGNAQAGIAPDSMGRPTGPTDELPQGDDSDDDEGAGYDTLTAMRRAKLKKEQLEVAKRERIEATAHGELYSREDVERRWLARVHLVGAGLLALPAKVAPRVVGRKARAVEKALDVAVRELLAAFAEEWPD